MIQIIFVYVTVFIAAVQSIVIHSFDLPQSRLLQQQQIIPQNLLRFDTALGVSSSLSQCINFNGLACTQCKQGYTLTNGKCYETIVNCLVQYTNICSTCQANYRPLPSLLNSSGQLSTFVMTCVPVSAPSINSSTGNNSNSSVNPLSLLGREQFISWTGIEVRYPTDVYLVMLWNFLDGNEDLRIKINIKDCSLASAVRGRVKNLTEKLTLINWIIQNQMTNFVEGLLVDIQNVFFYRLRYKVRSSQTEYEILAVIHEVNFQITLLQHSLVLNGNGTSGGNTPVTNSTLSESNQVKALRQEILDLKMEASQDRELYKRRQLLLLFFSQYSVLSPSTIQTDPGCVIIKTYIDNKFSEFIGLLNVSTTPNPGIYAWMNMQIGKVYFRKTDPVNREYVYEISFTDDVIVLVQFILGRLYEIVDVKVVYNS